MTSLRRLAVVFALLVANLAAADVPAGAEIRLQGTLGVHWSLDGPSLVVTNATRTDDAPDPATSWRSAAW